MTQVELLDLGPEWRKLWAFAEREAQRAGGHPSGALDEIGLLLHSPVTRWEYDATPGHSLTFASTGGDGVHYSLIPAPHGEGPIVMTVPMNFDCANLVVGAGLVDFLRIGYFCGFFVLEQLTYQGLGWPGIHHGCDDGDDLLRRLRNEFDLTPLSDPAAHLAELQSRFGAVVEPTPEGRDA